ncbi:cell wall-associated hydrolase [Paenibacillus sp. LMG 31456]|uniref:Cell wall-associated hydrolase n=1 Tax=Paenibacillus foliorum TaxID=2654974 RepID=A0A972GKF6_9BACL|nr:C40 family peptidase [Paenibacillus foliorum]NOU92389.1 cell wall-associated hydrolase [Paenibacillus foliorum]
MNNTKKNHFGKTLVGISLSLSVAFSGSMLLTPQSAHAATVSSSSVANNVISTGKHFLGVRYQFGASSGRTDAFDCSSFTQYVFKQNGISIPRSSRQQAGVGTAVSKSQLQAGDLIFSDTNRDGTINHVGIYMGNGQILHTYRVGIGVTISNFAGSTWDRTFVTARRVIAGGGQAVAVPAPQPAPQHSYKPAKPASKHSSQPKRVSSNRSSEGGNQQGEH